MAQINRPTDYFNTKLYTGTGATNNITGVGFQPDWVWVKRRDSTSDHTLGDSVRGTGKKLWTTLTAGEGTDANFCSSFDSDGFTVSGTAGDYNGSGATYASWNWLGGGTASSNTDGSITSTVSANTTSGFSIVSYTGTGSNATVGHGLGSAPKMIIVKNRDQADAWYVYHASLGGTKYMSLNSTGGEATNSTLWQDTNPTSSFFYIGTNNVVNTNTENYIAYCFAEKKGFSKFGSYTGNGNADGTFVYTGFKPAFLIVKRTSTAENWWIHDNKRVGYNVSGTPLKANSSDAEIASGNESSYGIDLLSNGFKARTSEGSVNTSGGTYIYMAFAENPLVSSAGVPCTAR